MLEGGAIGFVAAFAAGLVSFLSPCVLPLVPAYISYVAGQPLRAEASGSDARGRIAALNLSAFFVLGFSTVFVTLGASATLLGRLLLQYRYEANIVGGA
ncbi:MAG: cytochrome c biogenesis CcdA family protein, partial [Pseudomonadota bacterium]